MFAGIPVCFLSAVFSRHSFSLLFPLLTCSNRKYVSKSTLCESHNDIKRKNCLHITAGNVTFVVISIVEK